MNDLELNNFRKERLLAAVDKVTGGNRTEFGRRLGYKDGAFVRQMLAGERAVTEKTIRAIESMKGMSGWFSEHTSTPAESPKTGHIDPLFGETSTGDGHNIISHDIKPGPQIQGKLPLITWAQARNWEQLVNTFAQKEASDWLDCPVPHSSKSFCVENNSDAMDDGTASGYREGEILFVDPEVSAAAGDDVVLLLADGTMLFRRLKEDMEGLYLLGLNGKKITRLPDGAKNVGVVVFSGVRRR